MAYVITRLCRDCVDGDCVKRCPTDCIVEHRPTAGGQSLPPQLFIDPKECIDCGLCLPECPWEAIYQQDDVPDVFHDDIGLNALASDRKQGFHVPVERLKQKPSAEEVEANRQRWGLSKGDA